MAQILGRVNTWTQESTQALHCGVPWRSVIPMPVKLTWLERVAFALNVGPAPVIDYVGALSLQALLLGIGLGVFEKLKEGSATTEHLACELGADTRALNLLLDSLSATGYLRQNGDRYALTPMAAKWAPRFSDGASFYRRVALEGWSNVAARLRGQKTAGGNGLTPEGGGTTDAGMLSNARLMADEVARRVRLPGSARRMVDVGGGHGLYSAKLCERNHQLTAVVFDRPSTLELARRVLAEERAGDRVMTQTGDFWVDPLGHGYDVALLFNLLNGFPIDQRIELLRKVADATSDKGLVVVLDSMRRPTLHGASRAVVELTSLRLFDPEQNDTYRLDELKSWLSAAGWEVSRVDGLMSLPWVGFVEARKTAH